MSIVNLDNLTLRLGQKRDVNIFKLTVEDTVEDRELCFQACLMSGILALQENKRELAKAALSGEGATGVMKLTMDDLLSVSDLTVHVR